MDAGERPKSEDCRHMVKIIVDSMREHSLNPTRKDCTVVAKENTDGFPKSFLDKTEEGETIRCGYFSSLNQLKTSIEYLNRGNTLSRLRKPRCSLECDDDSGPPAAKCAKIDSYGCFNWQPQEYPQEETLLPPGRVAQPTGNYDTSRGPVGHTSSTYPWLSEEESLCEPLTSASPLLTSGCLKRNRCVNPLPVPTPLLTHGCPKRNRCVNPLPVPALLLTPGCSKRNRCANFLRSLAQERDQISRDWKRNDIANPEVKRTRKERLVLLQEGKEREARLGTWE
ncbi:hypothetical protein E1301_Tti013634 [Triplophysa tibetana]|uniref:Uncharacterized protein n=1 Tax=Triplophysa tibetana TaxID=1572043 RepID=A0A5A9NT07_9TELE|nr:hypothetical protein E1301_Tti013634 [Triplophysa tibetana]